MSVVSAIGAERDPNIPFGSAVAGIPHHRIGTSNASVASN
jgi:hypothetical protein